MDKCNASSEKLRVAFAWNYVEWGGAQMYFLGLARALKTKIRPEFWLPAGTSDDFLEMCVAEGVPFRFFRHSVSAQLPPSFFGKLKRHWAKLRSEIEMATTLRGKGYELLHVELGPWQSLTALLLLSRIAPVFHTIHNRLPVVSRIRSFSWRSKFKLAARCYSIHPFAANCDAKSSIGLYAPNRYVSRIVVTSANINPDELVQIELSSDRRRSVRNALGVVGEELLVLTVGQFIDRKGRWPLMESAKRVLEDRPGTSFRWITSSELTDEDRNRLEAHGLGEAFRVVTMKELGFDRHGVLEAMAAAEIFVLPSLVEGLPISLMEAMGLGVPVVATVINGIPEAVTDGKNGILVPPGSVSGLAAAITRLAEDEALRRRLSNAGREILASSLREDVVADLACARYLEAVR